MIEQTSSIEQASLSPMAPFQERLSMWQVPNGWFG